MTSTVLIIAILYLSNPGLRVEGDEEGWGKCPFLLLRGEGHHGKDYKSMAHQVGLCLPGKDHLALERKHENSLTDFSGKDSAHLYLAMEFHCGGDLLSLLDRNNNRLNPFLLTVP